MKKKLLLLATAALLLTTVSFAACRIDTVNYYNIPAGGAKTPTSRNINTYDAAGNMVNTLIQQYGSGTWNNYTLYTSTYNANNKMLTNIRQDYNTTTGTWVNTRLAENIYSGTNLIDAIVSVWVVANNAWSEDSRTTNTYTAQGKLSSTVSKTATVNTRKVEFTYDAAQNETVSEYFNWSSNSWVQSQKVETTYTAANKPSLVTNSNYNTSTSSYTGTTQDAYTYDASNNETQREARTWSGASFTATTRYGTTWSSSRIASKNIESFQGTWVTVERSDYTYDANGNLLNIIRLTSQTTTPGNPPSLQAFSRIVYEYNTANLQTRLTNQDYVKNIGFVTSTETVKAYTASGKLARVADLRNSGTALEPVNETLYEYNTDDDLIAIERRTNFNVSQGIYTSVNREEYSCGRSATPNGIDAIRESKLDLYPNPAVGSFLLETDAVDAMVTITDIVGKVVFEKPLAGDKMTISVADFSTGLYVVRIQGKNENVSRKLMVGK